jgi:hypothetical protein
VPLQRAQVVEGPVQRQLDAPVAARQLRGEPLGQREGIVDALAWQRGLRVGQQEDPCSNASTSPS